MAKNKKRRPRRKKSRSADKDYMSVAEAVPFLDQWAARANARLYAQAEQALAAATRKIQARKGGRPPLSKDVLKCVRAALRQVRADHWYRTASRPVIYERVATICGVSARSVRKYDPENC